MVRLVRGVRGEARAVGEESEREGNDSRQKQIEELQRTQFSQGIIFFLFLQKIKKKRKTQKKKTQKEFFVVPCFFFFFSYAVLPRAAILSITGGCELWYVEYHLSGMMVPRFFFCITNRASLSSFLRIKNI